MSCIVFSAGHRLERRHYSRAASNPARIRLQAARALPHYKTATATWYADREPYTSLADAGYVERLVEADDIVAFENEELDVPGAIPLEDYFFANCRLDADDQAEGTEPQYPSTRRASRQSDSGPGGLDGGERAAQPDADLEAGASAGATSSAPFAPAAANAASTTTVPLRPQALGRMKFPLKYERINPSNRRGFNGRRSRKRPVFVSDQSSGSYDSSPILAALTPPPREPTPAPSVDRISDRVVERSKYFRYTPPPEHMTSVAQYRRSPRDVSSRRNSGVAAAGEEQPAAVPTPDMHAELDDISEEALAGLKPDELMRIAATLLAQRRRLSQPPSALLHAERSGAALAACRLANFVSGWARFRAASWPQTHGGAACAVGAVSWRAVSCHALPDWSAARRGGLQPRRAVLGLRSAAEGRGTSPRMQATLEPVAAGLHGSAQRLGDDGLQDSGVAHANGLAPHGSAAEQRGLGPAASQNGTQSGNGGPQGGNCLIEECSMINLRVYHDGLKIGMGLEGERDMTIQPGDVFIGRYRVVELLGGATSSRVYVGIDILTADHVCLKVIKNDKDYFDQSLNEIKLLQYCNSHDPLHKMPILRMHDYFYYHEHLVIVTELLRENLYEWQHYVTNSTDEPPYFTLANIQKIAHQVLTATAFMHSLGLIHNDLKPENVAIESYSRTSVKLIDLGATRHVSDNLSSYVQSRSYRAPEVILGLPYCPKIDVWSIGAILAELSSGHVLFQNTSAASLLARLESILGPVPLHMLKRGKNVKTLYTRSRKLYSVIPPEDSTQVAETILLQPKQTTLADQVPEADDGFLDFLSHLLMVDPAKRPTAQQALGHPWLSQSYADT